MAENVDKIIEGAVLEVLKKSGLFDQLAAVVLRKDITPGDVHVSSAGADDGKKKPSLFSAAIEDVTDDIVPANAEGMEVEKAARGLRPIDDRIAASPFPYDQDAMGKLRPDQVPRYLGAITNPAALESRSMRLSSLVASQDRVDQEKVGALMAAGKVDGPPPVIVRYNSRNYIGDGHHRLTAAWMNGENMADVKFLDISAKDNALKSLAFEVGGETDGDDAPSAFRVALDDVTKGEAMAWDLPFEIAKAEPDQQLIFGWASIVEKDGYLVIDKQGDVILPEDLEKAAYDFALNARAQGDMHTTTGVGRMIESMVFTKEKQKALGIDLKKVGWWIGFKVDNPDVWALHKSGQRPEFSIGGKGVRIPLEK